MDLKELIILILHVTNTLASRKHHYSSEGSSIENLLFYQDCKHNSKTSPTPLRSGDPPKPVCPCPRMCCSMCCDCNVKDQSFMGRNSMSMMSNMIIPVEPSQSMQPGLRDQLPQPQPNALKRQRLRPPIPSRRMVGFTKNDIKNLISKDDDIKKILKDLVRVTMQKVDLVGMLNMNPNGHVQGTIENNEESYKELSDEEDELE